MTQPINLTPTRNHKIKSDYGMNDYYRFYKTNMGGTLGVKEFSKVFRILMEAMRQIVIENNYKYKLSSRMGVITTRKYKNKITFKDGKMVIKYPPDFKSTLKLWAENPESAKAKQLVRYENKHTNGHSYRIIYTKKIAANYPNKLLYKMKFNREFTKGFKAFIDKYGEIDRDML